ncbi:MAG: tRNA 4-thiouridine(8) synthase ThiI [Nitrospiraceae bacterium]|nr:tRNA 4-thiouridine(8) synthase ThiI [Nitrospiraceae bacterium]
MEINCVVVRYGEIALKGKNRPVFENKLINNIKKHFDTNNINYSKIYKISGRIIIKTDDTKSLEALTKIFGIVSFSPAVEIKLSIEDIKENALKLISDEIKNNKSSEKIVFRIITQRSDKNFNMTSPEVNREVSLFLADHFKDIGFDYNQYNRELFIEIGRYNAYLSFNKIKGLGGLPIGVSGRTLCLFSGGIDSPVAALSAMKRGCSVELIHFFNEKGNQNKLPDKMYKLYSILKTYQPNLKMDVVPFHAIEEKIVKLSPEPYRIIVLRIMFLRFIDLYFNDKNIKAVVTGDNLAQVASQTLDNLYVISKFSHRLILRPLVSFDKQETINLSKKYGTYEDSIKPYNDCCSYLLPKHPKTRAKYDEAKRVSDLISDDDLKALFEKVNLVK